MSNRNAFAIHSIKTLDANGNTINIPASVEGKPSVFPIDGDTFDQLEKLGAVRQATREEIAIAKDLNDRAEDQPRVTAEDTTTTLVRKDRATESTATTQSTQAATRRGRSSNSAGGAKSAIKSDATGAAGEKDEGSAEENGEDSSQNAGESSSAAESSNDDMGV